jgi:hypothetical protein
LLHGIANLVQEADAYLCESSLAPTPFSKSGQKRSKPNLSSTPFNRSNKKDEKGKGLFTAIKRSPLKSSGLQPHKADGIENRMRRSSEGLKMLDRNVFRAKRERKQRDRYNATKLTKKPEKRLGTWFRKR